MQRVERVNIGTIVAPVCATRVFRELPLFPSLVDMLAAVVADLVGDNRCVFLAGLYRAERGIAERLLQLGTGKLWMFRR